MPSVCSLIGHDSIRIRGSGSSEPALVSSADAVAVAIDLQIYPAHSLLSNGPALAPPRGKTITFLAGVVVGFSRHRLGGGARGV